MQYGFHQVACPFDVASILNSEVFLSDYRQAVAYHPSPQDVFAHQVVTAFGVHGVNEVSSALYGNPVVAVFRQIDVHTDGLPYFNQQFHGKTSRIDAICQFVLFVLRGIPERDKAHQVAGMVFQFGG